MFKLINGELKKIFLKNGIFVVTALLVLVLTFSAFLFKPVKRNNVDLSSFKGDTIAQVYTSSFGSSTSSDSKENINKNYVQVAESLVFYYRDALLDSNNSKKQDLVNSLNEAIEAWEDYKKLGNSVGINWNSPDLEGLRNKVKTTLDNFSAMFNSYVEGQENYYYILIPSDLKEEVSLFLAKATTEPFFKELELSYGGTYDKINEIQIYSKLTKYLEKINNFMPTQEAIDEVLGFIDTAKTNLALQESEIVEFRNEHASKKRSEAPELFQELKAKIIRYKFYSINLNELVKYSILDSAVENFTDDKIQSFYKINENTYTTKYKIHETKLIHKFYLDNNKTELDYANPLSLETTSNFEANGYDFMYFALTLCSFVIIAYVLFLGAGMIASEQTNGTLKLLAIRPYSRNKLLFSKLLSTILIGVIFLTLSFVITLIVGGILYGTSSLPILLAFNSSIVTSVSPIVAILILYATLLIQIIFYAMLSICISTLFKSSSGSIVVSILIFFGSLILTMFISSLGILKYLPFVNVNLFGYFGSNTVVSETNIIARMFTATVANDMNLYISMLISMLFAVILYVITTAVFSKRDIK